MSLDAKLDAILADATPALHDAIRAAYELGYRDALAARGPSSATDVEDDVEPPPPLEIEPAEVEPTAVPAAVDWGQAEPQAPDGPPEASREKAPLLRILPHATVGTLHERIVYHFDLARFDIDIVICRQGDRARRALKSSVRLSKYERGE